MCDARTVHPDDLIDADAKFARDGEILFSFVGWIVAHSRDHRWYYYRAMIPDEVLVFVSNDSDPTGPHCVHHSAFDDPSCPPGTDPRSSVEMRAIA
jgi:hypothetical protein